MDSTGHSTLAEWTAGDHEAIERAVAEFRRELDSGYYAMVTEDPADLANLPDYAAFLDRMGDVLAELHRVLRPRRYAALIVRDAYQGGRYLFTGSDLAARAASVGFVPKGDIVWYQAGTRLRPYGYPSGFVPNIVHQHVLILRR